jgi:signal transduction histidine kinase
MVVDNRSLGVLTLTFPITKIFDQIEQDFLISMARQCAQAIHRSQLYDNAKRAIEVRDEFLAIASHELRTPLTPLKMQIQGVARLLQDSFHNLTPERLNKMVETSERQINRLTLLIDGLLDVTRITSGKMVLNREYFNLHDMIKDVVAQHSQQYNRHQTTIDLVIKDDLVGLWDKVRIEQVITNILTNAVKYAPNKPIRTVLARKDSFAKIQITDQGPGIALEDQERIFNRYERVSDTQNIGGLGLGLYISKQIVEAHSGRIYVHSVPGHGSTFTIELPEVHS